ncbi:MAG: outer membrane protein assembly factor BamA [Rhodobacteraceae bacterium]|nr:outer membrane protein assembly factor BamA [Paracoccaceae bacterium]
MALVLSAALSPARAQSFSFNQFQIDGNQRVDDATILGLAQIPRATTISAGELNAAYRRVANSGLFETVEFTPRGATLAITVQELPFIGIVNFEGNRRINDDAIREVVGTTAGRVLSPSQVEADAIAIADLYRQRGRFAAEVTPRIIPRGNNRVDLAFEIREGNVVEIERLSFVGNRAFSDNRLRRVLDTKQAGLFRILVQRDTFVEDRIALDRELLRDFYLSRGYVDFRINSVTSEMARERDGFFITFNISEGLQYRVGAVSVASEIDGIPLEPYEQQVRLRSGVVFSPTVIETNIRRLERVATNEGRRFVRVEPRLTRNNRNQTIDVEFTLVEGERIVIERIDIQGNTTTLDRVIRRQFDSAEGDPLNPREIREAAERIRALGYFSDVQVEPRRGSSDDQAIVDVDVEEQPTGSLGFGVSYGVGVGIGFAINFEEANFLGRGQQVAIAFNTIRGSREIGLNFTEPALLDRNLRYTFALNYRETSDFNEDFSTRDISLRNALSFPVSEFGRLEGRIDLRSDQVTGAVAGQSSPRIVLDQDMGRVNTVSLGYTYTLDTRRSGYDPTRGYILQFSQDFGATSNSRQFVRTTARAGYEQRVLNEEVTLRADLTAGALLMRGGDSRITERFFLDGRMRGFELRGVGPRDLGAANRDALGGLRYAVAQFEADFPLGLPEEYGITGGVFMDVGTVWGLDNAGAAVDLQGSDSARIRAAAGVSLFWDTPIGPLRFDFSRALRKESYDRTQNFDLSIVTRF